MVVLKNITCGTCGVEHAIPQIIYDTYREEGGFWHCPNGHKRGWEKGQTPKDIDKIRSERDRAIQEKARLEDEVIAKEKEISRIKKRAFSGACQCCNRTFVNIARHMKTKHPEMLAQNVVKIGKTA